MSKLKVTEIDGIRYVSVPDASQFWNKSITQVRYLIQHGNSRRKLQAARFGKHYMIPEDELYNFPFVRQGNGSRTGEIYNYTKDGELVLRTSAESNR